MGHPVGDIDQFAIELFGSLFHDTVDSIYKNVLGTGENILYIRSIYSIILLYDQIGICLRKISGI